MLCSLWEFLKLYFLHLNLHLWLFGDTGENHNHAHTCLNQLSRSAPRSKCSYGSGAGGRHRQNRVVVGSTFPGCKKCPCPRFCEHQQPAKPGGWEGGVAACMTPATVVEGRKTHHDQQPPKLQAEPCEGPSPPRARDAGTSDALRSSRGALGQLWRAAEGIEMWSAELQN